MIGGATDLIDDSLSLKFEDDDKRSSLVGAIKTALKALFKATIHVGCGRRKSQVHGIF